MSKIVNLLFILIPCIGFAQEADLATVLEAAQEELTDVDTEKYSYEQNLEYDAEKPWRATIAITETNFKNDKSSTNSFYFNLADLDPKLIKYETDKKEELVVAKNRMKFEVPKGAVQVIIGTVNRKNLIREVEEGVLVGFENRIAIPGMGMEEASRLIQVLEATLPVARKLREARMPAPPPSDEGLQLRSDLLTGAERKHTNIMATINPTPQATLELTLTDTEKGDETTERYLFDFGDLNAKNIELRVKGVALDVMAKTDKGQGFIQKWEDVKNGKPFRYQAGRYHPDQPY